MNEKMIDYLLSALDSQLQQCAESKTEYQAGYYNGMKTMLGLVVSDAFHSEKVIDCIGGKHSVSSLFDYLSA